MVWVDILRGFFAICGFAVAVFVTMQLHKAGQQMRREMGPIPPENRRVMAQTLAYLGTAALLVGGAYLLGRSAWGSRTGAALAIAVFMVAVAGFFVWIGVLARREARRDQGVIPDSRFDPER